MNQYANALSKLVGVVAPVYLLARAGYLHEGLVPLLTPCNNIHSYLLSVRISPLISIAIHYYHGKNGNSIPAILSGCLGYTLSVIRVSVARAKGDKPSAYI